MMPARSKTASSAPKLAEQGVKAQAQALRNLRSAYRGYLAENEPARKNETGKTLIRAIFGEESIAEVFVR